jgi:hypothetical protein
LSNGGYNVHYIAVNWPHHVFESATFRWSAPYEPAEAIKRVSLM